MSRFWGNVRCKERFTRAGVPCTEEGCTKSAHYAGHPNEAVCSECYERKYKMARTQARCRHRKDHLQFLELGGCEDCHKRFAESPYTQQLAEAGLIPRLPSEAEASQAG